jgi:hypothetical protein
VLFALARETTGESDKWLAAAPASHFFLCANGGGVEELPFLLVELFFEPLVKLIGTVVVRFLFGK